MTKWKKKLEIFIKDPGMAAVGTEADETQQQNQKKKKKEENLQLLDHWSSV